MEVLVNSDSEIGEGGWLDVLPIHCHKRLPKNTLVSKLRAVSEDKTRAEVLMKFEKEKLEFFFDHEIDHLPGMLEVCGLRQCALSLGHLLYDVPMGHAVILDWINIKLHNYGELNVETIVKSVLVSIHREKHRIALVLEGTMMQGDFPVITMRGKMYAFSPAFFLKLRHKKFPLEEMSNSLETQKPLIAEVHILTQQNAFVKTYEHIVAALKSKKVENYALLPMYVNYDSDDLELRICMEFRDAALVDKFIVDKIRTIPGVEATRVRLTLDGRIFPKGVKALAAMDGNYQSCHIFLKIDPEKDGSAWSALRSLSDTDSVFPTWVFRDFYEYDRDVTLRLMGRDRDVLTSFVDDVVRKIEGVISCRIQYTNKVEKLLNDEQLMSFAQHWLR